MLKACVYTDSSKNAQNRQKNCQSRDFEPRSQGVRVFRIFRRSVFKEVEKGK